MRLRALLIALLLISACGSTADSDETTTAPTEPPTSAAGAAAPNGCLACHTDEEALRVLAVEPLETEVLSEGEG